MDPFRRPAAVVSVVTTVTVGMVMSASMRMMGMMVGLSAACAPRRSQHLKIFL